MLLHSWPITQTKHAINKRPFFNSYYTQFQVENLIKEKMNSSLIKDKSARTAWSWDGWGYLVKYMQLGQRYM